MEKDTYFITDHYKFIENNKYDDGTSLKSTNDSFDPFGCHMLKCGKNAVQESRYEQIYTYYTKTNEDDEEDDEEEGIWRAQRSLDVWAREQEALFKLDRCNGSNEVVKIFNQKCVMYFENRSVYAFRQCGHQCKCKNCHQSKGDIAIMICIIFTT